MGGAVLLNWTHRQVRVANGATDSALIRSGGTGAELIDHAEVDHYRWYAAAHRTRTLPSVGSPMSPGRGGARHAVHPSGVLVGTADALQGWSALRWSRCIRWPVSGSLTRFSVKPGRLCVMLSRPPLPPVGAD